MYKEIFFDFDVKFPFFFSSFAYQTKMNCTVSMLTKSLDTSQNISSKSSKITIKMTAIVQSPLQETKQRNQKIDRPCVEFSAMHFGPCPVDCRTEEACSFASSSTVSTASNMVGWGSAVSRKSYACLSSLDNRAPTQTLPRRVNSVPISGPSWGYFVDTVE